MIRLDYLTLTSYQRTAVLRVPGVIRSLWHQGEWKPAKVMQYKGFRNGPVFYGYAEQQEQRHVMLTISGPASHEIMGRIPPDITACMNATRLDMQVTVPLPFGWNENDIWNRVKDGVGKTKIVNDTEKTWTVYIGSRRSKIFWRIYTKHYEKTYLRYEVELKRSHAHTVFATLNRYGSIALSALYNERLTRLKLDERAKEPVAEIVSTLTGENYSWILEREEEAASLKKMCVWLDNLSIAFERRLGDHEVGHVMRNYIDQWAAMLDPRDSGNGGPGL